MLLADGFEECLIGVGSRCGQPDIAVYDQTKCIQVLMSQGMSHEEALEYFDFNVLGSWVGEETPIFVSESKLDD
tara:strand:- start:613 stop:834 length:222 start_codon:yes stop_codon:yes gene_type:complete